MDGPSPPAPWPATSAGERGRRRTIRGARIFAPYKGSPSGCPLEVDFFMSRPSIRILITCAASLAVAACTSSPQVTPAAKVNAPAPSLSHFVPSTQRVLRVRQFNLAGGRVPEVAVTTVDTQSGATPIPPENLLLLGWDTYAHRWFVAYNAARDPVTISSTPDASMSSSFSSAQQEPLLPAKIGATGLSVTELHDQPDGRGDLLFWANLQYGDGSALVVGIVHYNGQTANVEWSFSGTEGGTVSRALASPHQEVAVSTEWTTPVDPHCCPVRSYRFVMARSASPTTEPPYRVVSDNRPWLGAFIAELQTGGANLPSKAVVVSVIPGSPAAGVLQPMDVITGVVGAKPRANLLGPAVIDELAAYRAGDTVHLQIIRNGAPQTVSVKLGSMNNAKAVDANFPTPSFLGVSVFTVTQQNAAKYNLPLTQGADISQVMSGGPAEAVGLSPGDIITSANGLLVHSVADLKTIIAAIPSGTTVPIGYVTPGGVQRTANVTLGVPPSQDAYQIIMP